MSKPTPDGEVETAVGDDAADGHRIAFVGVGAQHCAERFLRRGASFHLRQRVGVRFAENDDIVDDFRFAHNVFPPVVHITMAGAKRDPAPACRSRRPRAGVNGDLANGKTITLDVGRGGQVLLEAVWGAVNGVFTLEGLTAVGKVIAQIVIIFILARLLLGVIHRVIDHVLVNESRRGFSVATRKETRRSPRFLKSVSFYAVFFIAGMMALEAIGINTASLLAAAGVAGLAIGIGAQNFVKDVVSGFFIIFEGQFRVGDYVGIGDVRGFVEQTGLRTTWIRTYSGEVHIIPNGEVRKVVNYMGPEMRVMFDVPISFEEDVDRAIAALEEAFERAHEGVLEKLVAGPKVLGVSNIGEAGVDLRIWARADRCISGRLGDSCASW